MARMVWSTSNGVRAGRVQVYDSGGIECTNRACSGKRCQHIQTAIRENPAIWRWLKNMPSAVTPSSAPSEKTATEMEAEQPSFPPLPSGVTLKWAGAMTVDGKRYRLEMLSDGSLRCACTPASLFLVESSLPCIHIKGLIDTQTPSVVNGLGQRRKKLREMEAQRERERRLVVERERREREEAERLAREEIRAREAEQRERLKQQAEAERNRREAEQKARAEERERLDGEFARDFADRGIRAEVRNGGIVIRETDPREQMLLALIEGYLLQERGICNEMQVDICVEALSRNQGVESIINSWWFLSAYEDNNQLLVQRRLDGRLDNALPSISARLEAYDNYDPTRIEVEVADQQLKKDNSQRNNRSKKPPSHPYDGVALREDEWTRTALRRHSSISRAVDNY